ncbi:hypothetical protein BKI52_44330 [marine bacterium AO1-C]|nr:hypothetical protein BKI52_44330 [marine bacterium AO1-C]
MTQFGIAIKDYLGNFIVLWGIVKLRLILNNNLEINLHLNFNKIVYKILYTNILILASSI